MVQVSRRDYDGSIEFCRIHDLLHCLAIKKAKDDNFLMACSKIDEVQNCSQTRRLAIQDNNLQDTSSMEVKAEAKELYGKTISSTTPNLRSLLCCPFPLVPNVSQLMHLKVFSNMGCSVEYEPEKLGRLDQLRFFQVSLEVNSNDVHSFQKFIGGMKFLQTLDLANGRIPCDLPDCVWHVKTLRHVGLPSFPQRTAGPPPSVDLTNLQTLTGVKSRESWEVAGLPKLPNLKYFGIEFCNIQRDTITTLLCTLEHLISLVILGEDVPSNIIDMIRDFPFYDRLQGLVFRDICVKKTALDVGMLPIHLTQLDLKISHGDPMPVLEKLENLKWLSVECREFQKMYCSVGGFVQLEELLLVLSDLEEWEIEEGALPMLKHLHLYDCYLLRVPLTLQHLTVLQYLGWRSLKSDGSYKISKTMENEIRNLCKHVPRIYIDPVEED